MKKIYRITFIVLAVISAFLGVFFPPIFAITAFCVYGAVKADKFAQRRETDKAAARALKNIRFDPAFDRPGDALLVKNYVVLDTETTGLSPEGNRIIEIAMIRVEDGSVVDEKTTFLNPGEKIPKKITEITGITNADVKGAMKQTEGGIMIAEFIGDLPIVAHNAPFDAKFVAYTLARAGIEKPIRYIDTLSLSKKYFPGRRSYKLASISKDLDLAPYEQTHRALDDAKMAHALFLRCVDKARGGESP